MSQTTVLGEKPLKGIRIFSLAKELGLANKDLIDYCAQAGIQVKNSALASISSEERDQVVALIQKGGGPRKVADVRAPIRDDVPDVSQKLRDIRTMAPRAPVGRGSARGDVAELESAGGVAVDVEIAPEPPGELPQEFAEPPQIVAEAAPTSTENAPPAPDAPPAPEAPSAAPPAAPIVPAVTAESPPLPDAGLSSAPSPAAPPVHRKEDYIPAGGAAMRRPSMFDMKPRGNVRAGEGDASRGPKAPGKSRGLPAIAMPPSYTPPKAKSTKPDEVQAQKPVVRLTPDMIANSPLGKQVIDRDRKPRPGEKTRSGKTLVEEFLEQAELSRKGGKGAVASPEGKLVSRKGRRDGRGRDDEGGDERVRRARMPRVKRRGPVALKTTAEVELPITVRSLSEAIGRPAKDILKSLFQRGQMATINEVLPEETALEIAIELGVDLTILHERDVEAELAALLEEDDDPELLVPRPPIITILGHVDHGKTTLLDKIRRTNVAAGEAGGITQHIASYQVEHNGQKVTFVDTPGHAAFGEMRARGANVTDIIVLVVAADDGVMPQTEECISHAKAAGVPIVVAMNKIDLPAANPQRVLQQLAAHEILATEWGGEVEVVRTSGATGEGLDTLLETLLLTAEIHELKANPERPAVGVCLEAFRDEGRGALAWLIVQKGTLHVGDVVLCGQSYGRIRAIYDDVDKEIDSADPSKPVKVAGLDMVPGAGDHFFALDDLEEARAIAESRRQGARVEVLSGRRKPRTLDDILEAARGGAVQDLPLILKVDTPGSLEALRHEIGRIDHPEVRVQVIHEAIGGVNESDVSLASASGAIIVAFHVIPEDRAQVQAERDGVEIRQYDIIYEVTDHIKRRLEGLLIPEKKQVNTGRAIVLQTFHISRLGTIAGCRVLSGVIERNSRIQLIRDQKVLNDYAIASLKREKDDAREVREGFECGIRLEGFNDVKEGDILQAYKVEEIKRTLE